MKNNNMQCRFKKGGRVKKNKKTKSEFYTHEIDEWIFEFRKDFNEQTKKLLGKEVFPKREIDIMDHIKELIKVMETKPNEQIREELRVYRALYKGYGLGWYIAVENLGHEISMTNEAEDLGISIDELREKKAEEWDKKEEKEIETILDQKPVNEEVFQKWKKEISNNSEGFWEDDPNTKMKTFIFSNPTPIVQDISIEKSKWGKEDKKKKK
jgi:ribosomal protein L13E